VAGADTAAEEAAVATSVALSSSPYVAA